MQSNNTIYTNSGLLPSPRYAGERDRVRGDAKWGMAAASGPLTPGPSPRCAGRGGPNLRAIWLSIVFALFASPAFAQRDLKDIPPPDPELERQALQLGEGLEINLYAADPLLAKPIQMNFDPQGRLWIATSETYPQIEPGKTANDKIIVLEDADRDGRADKTHVFADGLLIPTGIEPGDGGAYVANSTELLHFTDKDGDLKADGKRTLLSGFGTEDTHHILHTLRWGPDGRLYMNQSIYIHSHIETPYGVRRLNGGGIWQYDPRTHRLEIFARGWVNAWGHAFDRWGNSFVTDGAGGEGINYAFPGAVYPTAPGAPRVLHGMNPGSPKYCGLEIISGPHWPDDWQGDLITCDFRAHRVVRFKLAENGSGYTAREVPELIKTTHVAFRPIDVKLGPDGALYIADWYNPIIQHGEVDFRDPRRDHTHGRIWRVTAKGRKPAPWPYQPQRPEIDSIYAAERTESGPQVLLKKLEAPDHHVRAAAVRVAGSVVKPDTDLYVGLTTRAIDENAQVRLEAICALRNVRRPEAIASALQALDRPMDENLDFALWQTCREQKDVWLPAVLDGSSSLCDAPQHLEFALRAVDEPNIVPPLLKLLDGGKVADDRRDGILTLIARLGGPQELGMIFRRVHEANNSEAALQRSLLAALAEAMRTRKVAPVGDLSLVDSMLDATDDGVAIEAAKLVVLWNIGKAIDHLRTIVNRPGDVTPRRLAALDALVHFESPNAVLALCQPEQRSFLRQAAVIALATKEPQLAADEAVEMLAAPEFDVRAVVDAFASRPPAAIKLREALVDAKLPQDAAKIAIRAALAAAKPDEALVAALRKAGGIAGTGLQLSPEQTLELVSEIKTRGDAARGEAIYLRKDLGCTKCHAIGGAGGKVGPDLISIGASAQVDYLVDSLVVPNKAVKEGYHTAIVELDDGRVLNGVKVRQTDKDLILRDAEDRELNVPLNSIESQAPGMSLMPAGLVDNLTRDELIDLVRFLSELGKIGPYQLTQAKLVRRWETLALTKDSYEVVRRQGIGAVAGSDRRLIWEPQFARIDGTLRLEALPAFAAVQNTFMSVPPYSVVRFSFDAAADGDVDLQINDATGLQTWLDGKPIELKSTTRLTVAAGRRTLTLVVDRKSRSAPLRCELIDVAGSAAAARPISVP